MTLPTTIIDITDLELICEPSLSVCCFRYAAVPSADHSYTEAYLDGHNGQLEAAMARDGRALMTGTRLNGCAVLRTCIVNHKASSGRIEETLELIRELGEKLHLERA